MDTNVYKETGLRWRDVRTGLLGVIGLGVMAWLALIIGENNGLFAPVDTISFFTSDVQGLVEGNQVTIAGKKVGAVDRLEIISEGDSTGVRVYLSVRREYLKVLTADSKAVVKSLGVLGDKYVDLVRGSGHPLLAGARIAVVAEPGIEELTASGIRTLNRVDQLGAQLAEIATRINRGEGTIGRLLTRDDLGDRVDDVLKRSDHAASSLVGLLDRVRSGDGLLPRVLNDPSMSRRVDNVLAALDQFATELRSGQGTLGKLMASDSLYVTLASLTRRVDSLTSRLASPTGSLGKLSNDPTLYDNLNSSLRSLDSLFQDLKANPGRYVSVSVF